MTSQALGSYATCIAKSSSTMEGSVILTLLLQQLQQPHQLEQILLQQQYRPPQPCSHVLTTTWLIQLALFSVPCGTSYSPFRASTTPILPSLHLQWNLLPVSTCKLCFHITAYNRSYNRERQRVREGR